MKNWSAHFHASSSSTALTPRRHIDGDWYRHFLDSGEGALVIIQVYTDILPRGGGTYICEDGLPGVTKFLYDRPQGVDAGERNQIGMYEHVKQCSKFHQFEAKAGDTLLLHAHLPHATGPNYRRAHRVIANPHVTLKDPFNLNRSNPEDYSLVEQVILRSFGRTSIPEYIPTQPRERYYPKNYVAKFARVRGELERMVHEAEKQGKSRAEVDSVYLKGIDAIREHNVRNGFGTTVQESQLIVVP